MNNKTIAVAIDRDKGSQSALKWTVDNLLRKEPNRISDFNEDSFMIDPDAHLRELFLPFRFQSNTAGWDNIIDEFAHMPNKSSIWSIVRRLYLASAVYSIWRERNNRVFRDEVCNWEVVLEMTCETVRLKLMGLIVKNTNAVQPVAKKWNVVLKGK
nr:reverse transcriptase zinc-binding domain-containing protein [Tanacetum cinerariifolium]